MSDYPNTNSIFSFGLDTSVIDISGSFTQPNQPQNDKLTINNHPDDVPAIQIDRYAEEEEIINKTYISYIESFYRFFNHKVIDYIITQTSKKIAKRRIKNTRSYNSFITTREELYTLVGIIFFLGW